MRIIETTPILCISVTTDETKFNEYIRYSVDFWYVKMGESEEPVYECKEIERLYQEYIREN